MGCCPICGDEYDRSRNGNGPGNEIEVDILAEDAPNQQGDTDGSDDYPNASKALVTTPLHGQNRGGGNANHDEATTARNPQPGVITTALILRGARQISAAPGAPLWAGLVPGHPGLLSRAGGAPCPPHFSHQEPASLEPFELSS